MTNNIRPEILKLAQPIDSISTHARNVRQGDVGAIVQSLEAHGQYRPIVVHKSTNQILAGNHTYLAAKSLGWDKIAVTFVDCDDEQALRILIADNRTNDLATYDDAGLAELLKELAQTNIGLQGTLYEGDALDQLLFDLTNTIEGQAKENNYSKAINVPHYEIVGEQPATADLINTTKSDELLQSILSTELDDDVREFLIAASKRHIVFNYQKIAEYYPHASIEVQRLMEQSVLIIIDAENAIANGFAKFRQTIQELMDEDDN